MLCIPNASLTVDVTDCRTKLDELTLLVKILNILIIRHKWKKKAGIELESYPCYLLCTMSEGTMMILEQICWQKTVDTVDKSLKKQDMHTVVKSQVH